MIASGISDPTQMRALLLHLPGLHVRDIFNNSIPAITRGEAKHYKKAVDSLSDHFKVRKNAPMRNYKQFHHTTTEIGRTLRLRG